MSAREKLLAIRTEADIISVRKLIAAGYVRNVFRIVATDYAWS